MKDKKSQALVPRIKQESLVEAQSGGILQRMLVVGFSCSVVFGIGLTSPLTTAAAIIGMVAFFIDECRKCQTPQRAKQLEEILESNTPIIPSIRESKKALKKQYPMELVNRAINDMLDFCEWVQFAPTSKHRLAAFGEVYAYIDPRDGEIMLPIEGIHKKLQQWGVQPTIDVPLTRIPQTSPPKLVEDLLPIDTPTVQEEGVSSPKTEGYETFNLPKELALLPKDDAQSILIIGEPGTGKGLFIQTWKDVILESDPNAQLFAINPKPDKREAHRWKGFKQVGLVYGKGDAIKALDNLRKFEKAMEARLTDPQDFLLGLVIDEYNVLCDFWTKEQKDEASKIIKRVAKQGRSLLVRILLGLHSPNADELNMSASDRACFTTVALGYKNKQQVMRLAIANNNLFPGLPQEIQKRVQALKGQPVGIAVCSYHEQLFILPELKDDTPPIQPDLIQESEPEVIIPQPEAITQQPVEQPTPTVQEDLNIAVMDVVDVPDEVVTTLNNLVGNLRENGKLTVREFVRNPAIQKLKLKANPAWETMQKFANENGLVIGTNEQGSRWIENRRKSEVQV